MCCGVLFLLLLALSIGVDVRDSAWLVGGLWASGLLALVGAVAASRIGDDPSEDPHYLGTIAHGLRAEWDRSHRA